MNRSDCKFGRSWHMFYPFHGTWRCADCCITPDYSREHEPCPRLLTQKHAWIGHNDGGLLCTIPNAVDVATEHVCHCGAGRFVKPYTLREPELNSEPG